MTNLELLQRKVYDDSLSILDLRLIITILMENNIQFSNDIILKYRNQTRFTVTDVYKVCDTLNGNGYFIDKSLSLYTILCNMIIIIPSINGGGGGGSDWILTTGSWDDSKTWIDTEVWVD